MERWRKTGIKKFKEEERKNTAKNMLTIGLSTDIITHTAGLSLMQIEQLL